MPSASGAAEEKNPLQQTNLRPEAGICDSKMQLDYEVSDNLQYYLVQVITTYNRFHLTKAVQYARLDT